MYQLSVLALRCIYFLQKASTYHSTKTAGSASSPSTTTLTLYRVKIPLSKILEFTVGAELLTGDSQCFML